MNKVITVMCLLPIVCSYDNTFLKLHILNWIYCIVKGFLS